MPEDTPPPADPQEDATDADENEDNLPQCNVAVEDAGTLKKKITVTVPRVRIDAKFDEMYGELGGTAQIPGFRVGHAPRRLIEKRFGKEVGGDVRNSIIGDSLGDAIEQADLTTMGEPDLDLDAIELPDTGDMEYSFEVEVAPEFDLPDTKGIAVDKPALEVTDEQIDEQIKRFLTSRAKFEPTDNPAGEGDLVEVDAVLTADDCDDVKRDDLTLRVAPGQIEGLAMVDLGDELTGKKAGDTVTVKATAPTVHPHEPWRDKEVSAELTIKQVTGRILPELDDAFAEQAGFDNVADMREFISGQLSSNLEAETQRAMRNQICQHLLSTVEFDLPEGVVARHTQQAMQRRYVELLQRGIPREQIDENLTELQADAATQAMTELKLTFILGKIADAQKVEVSDDEINSHVAHMAAQYNRRPERMRQELTQDGTIDQVATAIREQKAIDTLLADAAITEISAEELAKKAEAARKKAEKAAKADADELADESKQVTAKKAAKKTEKKATKKTEAKESADKPAAKKAAKKTAKKTAKKASGKSDKDTSSE